MLGVSALDIELSDTSPISGLLLILKINGSVHAGSTVGRREETMFDT